MPDFFILNPKPHVSPDAKKTIYDHITGRYSRVLMIVFTYTAAIPKSSLNQTLLIIAEMQKKMQNIDE